ncbi:opsin-1, short-wave-sensitive 1 isoform X2 [Esox lucius]|nr:opsin-1, short-wave-sensitive 1 isoform X2 [Esox lucius]
MAMACLCPWVTGVVCGSIPVVYHWVRYDPAEMLCGVFWMNSYSDMLVYILSAFSVCIFLPFLLIVSCSLVTAAGCGRHSDCDLDDLSSVTPLVVVFYLFCYTPFAVSELILLGRLDLSPAPYWIRTLSSVMSYLDCVLNPIIYATNQDFRVAGLALFWSSCKKPLQSEPVLTVMNRLEL